MNTGARLPQASRSREFKRHTDLLLAAAAVRRLDSHCALGRAAAQQPLTIAALGGTTRRPPHRDRADA
jgi:hypothetical protein